MTVHLIAVQSLWNYELHGIVRKNSNGLHTLRELDSNVVLHYGDTTDT